MDAMLSQDGSAKAMPLMTSFMLACVDYRETRPPRDSFFSALPSFGRLCGLRTGWVRGHTSAAVTDHVRDDKDGSQKTE